MSPLPQYVSEQSATSVADVSSSAAASSSSSGEPPAASSAEAAGTAAPSSFDGGASAASSSGNSSSTTSSDSGSNSSSSGPSTSSSASGSSSGDGPWLDPSRPRVLPRAAAPAARRAAAPLPLLEALRAVKEGARARFDETVEAHVRLKVDPRRGDQMVRGAAALPHATGKRVRVAAFAEGAAADAAREAGADVVGGAGRIGGAREAAAGLMLSAILPAT